MVKSRFQVLLGCFEYPLCKIIKQKLASRPLRIDVCVLNIFLLHLKHFSILKIENLHWLGGMVFEPMNPHILAFILGDPEAFHRQHSRVERMDHSRSAFTWASIFAVKVCFLLLFYDMLTRLRRLILAWKIIFGMTVLFWALCTCAIFFSCPHFAKTTTKSAIHLQSNSVPH